MNKLFVWAGALAPLLLGAPALAKSEPGIVADKPAGPTAPKPAADMNKPARPTAGH
jgi:hypothetical protein